jgi:RNA recognition motif-containing protein
MVYRTDSKASADPDATCALKLRGIPWSCEDTDIYEFFEGFKVVEDSAKLEVYDDGKKSGNAIILFESIDEC